jgi:hypothetical protein
MLLELCYSTLARFNHFLVPPPGNLTPKTLAEQARLYLLANVMVLAQVI